MPDTFKREPARHLHRSQENLPLRKIDPSALTRLFDEWMNEDESEQRETFEMLRRSLDQGRPAGFKLFS
jgi:hypothetical protein